MTNAMSMPPPQAVQSSSDDWLFRCAICGTAEGDASNLGGSFLGSSSSLQTNATVRCGHQFCNTCIDRELSRKREFPCPVCQTPVKRVTLTQRSLDDVQCEKDTSWRRRVRKVFNKTEADFDELQDYNNYLEEIEDMIYSIVNEEPNAEDVKAKIKEYEQQNRAEIVIRQSQRADEERSVQDQIAAEQRQTEQARRLAQQEERIRAMTQRKLKQETTQVLLGEREEVSAELKAAQMAGYRNELLKQQNRQQGVAGAAGAAAGFVSPNVRENPSKAKNTSNRDVYRNRQAAASAGGGIPVGSIVIQERNWNETVSSLFSSFHSKRA